MDLRSISEAVDKLLMERKYTQTEALLHEAHAEAASQNDFKALEHVCMLFVHVYGLWQLELIDKAEQFSIERERISPRAYNELPFSRGADADSYDRQQDNPDHGASKQNDKGTVRQ